MMTSSLSNRNSLLNDLDTNLSASSTRKKLRSDFDNTPSFEYGSSTVSGSGYGSSRRFEGTSAISSSYSNRDTASTIRRNYLDDDDDDFSIDKYSPRRLGMLSSGRQQQSLLTKEISNSGYKKYLDDDDDNDLSIGSSSMHKRTRYSKLDDLDDKDDNFSIRSNNMRKYSSSSNASYLKDDPEQFYAELTSRTSNRLINKRNQDDDFNYSKDDDDLRSTSSRFLSKQSTREETNRFQIDDDYLSTTSSRTPRQDRLSRLSSKEETGSTISSSKPPSRFLSKYASREQIQDDDDEMSNKYFASPRKTSRFSSREELNKDDDNGRESLLKYKKYSREESNSSVLNERPLIPENRLNNLREEMSNEKNEINTFSSLSFKTSRMFKQDSQEKESSNLSISKQHQSISSTSKTGSSFFDKENHSKSYSEEDNSVLDAKVCLIYLLFFFFFLQNKIIFFSLLLHSRIAPTM